MRNQVGRFRNPIGTRRFRAGIFPHALAICLINKPVERSATPQSALTPEARSGRISEARAALSRGCSTYPLNVGTEAPGSAADGRVFSLTYSLAPVRAAIVDAGRSPASGGKNGRAD